MSRKPREERTSPADWRLEKFENGEYQNADGMWRVIDGRGETIAIASNQAITAIFAFRHLLTIAKVSHSILKGLNPLKADWLNIEHILKFADPTALSVAQEAVEALDQNRLPTFDHLAPTIGEVKEETGELGQLTKEMLSTGQWMTLISNKKETENQPPHTS